jgi:hypothetical protein
MRNPQIAKEHAVKDIKSVALFNSAGIYIHVISCRLRKFPNTPMGRVGPIYWIADIFGNYQIPAKILGDKEFEQSYML